MLRHLLGLLGLWPMGTRGSGQAPYEVAGHDTRVVLLSRPERKVQVMGATGSRVVVMQRPGAKVEVL